MVRLIRQSCGHKVGRRKELRQLVDVHAGQSNVGPEAVAALGLDTVNEARRAQIRAFLLQSAAVSDDEARSPKKRNESEVGKLRDTTKVCVIEQTM